MVRLSSQQQSLEGMRDDTPGDNISAASELVTERELRSTAHRYSAAVLALSMPTDAYL